MVVPATPVQQKSGTVPGTQQNVLTPQVATNYGQRVLARLRSVQLQAGQRGTIEWTMLDYAGNAVDLTSLGFVSEPASLSSENSSTSVADGVGRRIELKLQENLMQPGHPTGASTLPAVIVDAAGGRVQVAVSRPQTEYPGVYFGDLAVLDDDGAMLFSNTFYVIINRGQYGANSGPPTMAEIRLHLRDSDPRESLLLDNVTFDDAEIAAAISRPIMQFNEYPPDLDRKFSTQNFPWRYHWLEAICGNLFLMLGEAYRKNDLRYQAAGITIDDQGKEPNYEAAAQRRLANWTEWFKKKKYEINVNSGYSTLGSDYHYWYGVGE